ncbi:hypothetical protein B0H14DRAFT_3448864 [Mycena olivaceomarginata]|nr:hypothetical protein B0H14DRAFT_3448864 [Mycena olivaceomarginata]
MAPGKTPAFADRRANRKSASSSSRLISVTHARRSATGHLIKTSRTLTSAQVREEKRAEEEREALRLAALSHEQLRERNAWLYVPDSFNDDDATVGSYEDDVLHGRVAADISHAGEAVQEDAAVADSQTLLEKLRTHHNLLFAKRRDTRNRNNRTQVLVDAFAAQMP